MSHSVDTEVFDLGKHRGELVASLRPPDLEVAIASLVQPSASSDTLHWGRNYLYGTQITTEAGDIEVVIKQFRNQGLRRRWERRLKGSKAERSWRAALALRRAGIKTPEPLVWIESRDSEGPSHYVSRRLPEFLEARYYFRALEAGDEKAQYPQFAAESMVEELGRAIRRLHDAGIWHRDLSIGNVLLVGGRDSRPEEVYFIDLNRARIKGRLTTLQRTRDLCRLRIFRTDLQDRFLRAYWGPEPTGLGRRRWLYRLLFHGFLLKVWLKKIIRWPFGGVKKLLSPRHPHVHIPQPRDKASTRDLSVWDGLSDQPHQHASRLERLAVRIADAPLHAREWSAALRALPRIRRRYLELKSRLNREPVDWQGMGIAVRPWPANPEALLDALEALGTRRVILRLHAWQRSHDHEEALARELHARGYELAFVLAQNRDLVRDGDRWRAAVTELSERFGRFGDHFQIGQAINRSKWGIWNYREYLELASTALEVLRREPQRQILGPGVIDYEPARTAGILNVAQQGIDFDILASLLYVDRRGAPENTQLGFDTIDKVLQMQAIAETSPHCGNRSWITEVNWPLWEGPHSPAGRKVSVDEDAQASYLARYYLLALGTGAVERVYWWQLVARGYGLSYEEGDGSLRRRRSFQSFVTLRRLLEESVFLGPVATPPPACLYRFRTPAGEEWIAAWAADDAARQARLPRPTLEAIDRDGQRLEITGRDVPITGSPRYFHVESE